MSHALPPRTPGGGIKSSPLLLRLPSSCPLAVWLSFLYSPSGSDRSCLYTLYVLPRYYLVACPRLAHCRSADLRHRTSGASSSLPHPELTSHLQWSTTWDRDDLFTYTNLSPNPIDFVSPGADGQADIVVTDGTVYQDMIGFGATLSE